VIACTFVSLPTALRCALPALLCLFLFCHSSRAAEVSPFLDLDAGACEKLEDKNLQVGPPDAEIVAACAGLTRSRVFNQKFSGGPGALAFALVGMVLVYGVFGVPMRSIAALFRRSSDRLGATLPLTALLSLLVRCIIGLAFVAILALPYAPIAGAVALMALLFVQLRRQRVAATRSTATDAASSPRPLSVMLADLINDGAASVIGLLGLVVLARRDPWLVGCGIAFAIIASLPAAIAARRSLWRRRAVLLGVAALLGALLGYAATADVEGEQALEQTTLWGLLPPLLFASAAFSAVWVQSRRRIV
jgi:hypothetical protein